MTTISLLVTLTSLLLAAGMGILVIRILRDERRRSDARVAALTHMAGSASSEWSGATHFPSEPEPDADGNGDGAGMPGLFADVATSSPWRRRLGIAGGLAIAVCATVLLASWSSEPVAQSSDAAAASSSAPLELVSLAHADDGARFTVTGMLQNPRHGAPVSRLTATAFLLGHDGTIVASGRAPLDITALRPGDPSPFVVTIPISGNVARYRVSFHDEDGRVVTHVDRRSGPGQP